MNVRNERKTQGFTIVELLIVIVVIAILAAISVAAYNGIQQRARDSRRVSDVKQIAQGMQMWSIESGASFWSMNTGNGVSASGWYDTNYGGGSVQSILQDGGYVARNIDDPLRGAVSNSRWRYMVAPCTSDVNDNRRVVMAELENAPSQSVSEQLQGTGCNHSHLSSYPTNYRVNYVQVADAR